MARINAKSLVAGTAQGTVLKLEPLSFWGGFDSQTGCVTEPSHPQYSICLSQKIVVMESGRGSSSSSSVLAEAIRLGTAPAAFLLLEVDTILATGALVAAELYQIECPILVLTQQEWSSLETGMQARVESDTIFVEDT
ncbi:MAG: hypothetical protein RLZZ156_1766 [Deinococcota bacterium]|jgi:uncharacterized protein